MHPRALQTLLGLFLVLATTLGCTTSGQSPGAAPAGDAGNASGGAGLVSLSLSLPGAVTISEVRYTVTGPTPRSGTVDVTQTRSSIEFVVGPLAAGSDYAVTLSATDTAGDACVSAPTPFVIMTGVTTALPVDLACTVGDGAVTVADAGTGSPPVDASVTDVQNPPTVCPVIAGITVTPAEETVGASSTITVVTTPAGAAVTYSVEAADPAGAASGAISVPTSSGATFTCTSAGQVRLTATTIAPLRNDAGSCPPSSMSALVTCEAALDDAGAHRVVLSGGFNADGGLTDTWLWDGTGWTQQSVSGPTPARSYAAAATLDGKMVQYGGLTAPMPTLPAFGFLADTWVYDGHVWTQQNVSGPGNRFGAAAGALEGQVVLFGGDANDGSGLGLNAPPAMMVGDTWTWNGTGWTLHDVPGPTPRQDATAAAWNGKLVLFGGAGGASGSNLSDTWIWDGASWTQQNVTGPAGRFSACAATLNGEFVLFGGTSTANTSFGDTWVWDGANWTQESGPGPSPRYDCRAVTLDGKIVLFGGTDATSGALGDTWLWDGSTWTQANVTGPPARSAPVMSTL